MGAITDLVELSARALQLANERRENITVNRPRVIVHAWPVRMHTQKQTSQCTDGAGLEHLHEDVDAVARSEFDDGREPVTPGWKTVVKFVRLEKSRALDAHHACTCQRRAQADGGRGHRTLAPIPPPTVAGEGEAVCHAFERQVLERRTRVALNVDDDGRGTSARWCRHLE